MAKQSVDMMKIVKTIRKQVIEEFRLRPGKAWVVKKHLLVVEKFAKKLCQIYKKADKEVVMLGIWLHDIGRVKDLEDHDLYGAKMAKKILRRYKLPKEKIDLVYEACRAHRSKEVKPKSLEAKILATADAMSHLAHGFYLRLFFRHHFGEKFEDTKKGILKKLERDFNDKIYFPEAKKMMKSQYEAWKEILTD